MKFIHLSDLHIGKRLCEYSLKEDQEFILNSILDIIGSEKPDGVIIAGDVYDKSVPSGEAVTVFDDFITRLFEKKIPVFIVSGNHDSAERLSFGSAVFENGGVYISNAYNGTVKTVTLNDSYGEYRIHLLPFVKPAIVRQFFPENTPDSYDAAVRLAISGINADFSKRNILVSHQFVTGAERSESEEINVGGVDNVDADAYDGFDYVALGHLHSPQKVTDKIRYAGSPLKYSFSEVRQEKSVTVVELKEKGNLSVRTIPLIPRRELREIIGRYEEIIERSFYKDFNLDDYFRVVLTDEEDVLDALQKLKTVYPNIMRLEYDNTRTRSGASELSGGDMHQKSPEELADEFYKEQNGKPLNKEQLDFIRTLIGQIWEDKE